MSLSHHVRIGAWTDFSSNQFQTLQSDYWANWLKAGASAVLTLCLAYIWKILVSSVQGFDAWWMSSGTVGNGRPRHDQQSNGQIRADEDLERGEESDDLERERVPLLPPANRPVKMLKESAGGRDFVAKCWENSSNGPNSIVAGFLLLIILSVFVAMVIAEAFVSNLGNDKAGLLDESNCGLFEFNETRNGNEAAARSDVYMWEREKRAADYAQRCYLQGDTSGPDGCNDFYNASISYQRPPQDQHCPFHNSTICAGLGYNTGVTFDTGLKDPGVLGVNDKYGFKWRRILSCAPLDMDHKNIRGWINRSTNETGYHYYYGKQLVNPSEVYTNYTLRTSGNPFDWLAPGYWVNTFGTTLDREGDLFEPIEALRPPQGSTFTVIFVKSTHIYYEKPSNDLIFPATDESPDGKPYWVNLDARARPLGCVDTTRLCSPSGDQCWAMNEPLPPGVPHAPSYFLMKYALARSSTYDSITHILGGGLLAQQRIGQSRSLALRDGHWEDEVEHLFASSLARAQYDAWSIASGEARDEVGYEDMLPDELRGRLCGVFKLNTIRHVNLRIFDLVMIYLSFPIAFILSLPSSYFVNAYNRCLRCYTGRGKEDKIQGPKIGKAKGKNPQGQDTQKDGKTPGNLNRSTASEDGNPDINNENRNEDVPLGAVEYQACTRRAADNGIESSNNPGNASGNRSNFIGDENGQNGNANAGAGTETEDLNERQKKKPKDDTWEPLVVHSLFGVIWKVLLWILGKIWWIVSQCLACFKDG